MQACSREPRTDPRTRWEAARAASAQISAPDAQAHTCVVIPARNEATLLQRPIAALAQQRNLDGAPMNRRCYEVLVLLNNCTDHSAAVARRLQRRYPGLRLHILQVTFAEINAHVGRARQMLFDTAAQRMGGGAVEGGLILTTDADSRPASDWVAQTRREVDMGAVGVGGRVFLEPAERAALDPAVERFFLLDIGYRRALEELADLYAPSRTDPFPRHHQHFGASLAITAGTYLRIGGMPALRSSEDVALYRAIVRAGGSFRHSERVQVFTSARSLGRAEAGLADAIAWWQRQARDQAPVMVESAAAADERLRKLGQWVHDGTGEHPPDALSVTAAPTRGTAAEIQQTLHALRARIATLRPLPLGERLAWSPLRDQHRRPGRAPAAKPPFIGTMRSTETI